MQMYVGNHGFFLCVCVCVWACVRAREEKRWLDYIIRTINIFHKTNCWLCSEMWENEKHRTYYTNSTNYTQINTKSNFPLQSITSNMPEVFSYLENKLIEQVWHNNHTGIDSQLPEPGYHQVFQSPWKHLLI